MLKVNPASSAPTDGTLRPNVPHASAAGQRVLLTGGFYSSISNCSYTPFATCRNNFARGSESTGVVHRIGFLIFFLCIDEMNRQFWARARVQGRMFALPAGQLRQGGGTALHRFACRSFQPRSSTTTEGWGSVLFISNKSFVIGSGDCVHKKDWDRLTATAGAGWQRALLVCFTFCTRCILYCLLRSSLLGPFCPFALLAHRLSGARGAGGFMGWLLGSWGLL